MSKGINGAAFISGIYNGVQSPIRKKYPSAMFVHYSGHILNLVSKSCNVRPITNSLNLNGEIRNFFIFPK